MIVIIDLMGNDETVVVGGEDAKQDAAEKLKREQALREIMERTPQPQVIPVADH